MWKISKKECSDYFSNWLLVMKTFKKVGDTSKIFINLSRKNPLFELVLEVTMIHYHINQRNHPKDN